MRIFNRQFSSEGKNCRSALRRRVFLSSLCLVKEKFRKLTALPGESAPWCVSIHATDLMMRKKKEEGREILSILLGHKERDTDMHD